MPKLLSDPNPLRVRDNKGREWSYDENEVKTEEYSYSDYQDPMPIKMVRRFIELPDGTRAIISEAPKSSLF